MTGRHTAIVVLKAGDGGSRAGRFRRARATPRGRTLAACQAAREDTGLNSLDPRRTRSAVLLPGACACRSRAPGAESSAPSAAATGGPDGSGSAFCRLKAPPRWSAGPVPRRMRSDRAHTWPQCDVGAEQRAGSRGPGVQRWAHGGARGLHAVQPKAPCRPRLEGLAWRGRHVRWLICTATWAIEAGRPARSPLWWTPAGLLKSAFQTLVTHLGAGEQDVAMCLVHGRAQRLLAALGHDGPGAPHASITTHHVTWCNLVRAHTRGLQCMRLWGGRHKQLPHPRTARMLCRALCWATRA